VNEYVKQLIGERKAALNVLFIVFPSAMIANGTMRILIGENLSFRVCLVLFFAMVFLLFRFYLILQAKIIEHVIIDEIIFDKKNGKVLMNIYGRRVLDLINEVFKEKVKADEAKIKEVSSNAPKELPDYSEVALDIFEFFVISIIERSQMGVQITKYSYSLDPKSNPRQISFEELPVELRLKNLIYSRFEKELKKTSPTIADSPFWLPFNSSLEYCREEKNEKLRKIMIRNNFGKLEVALGKGSFGYKEKSENKESFYYLPYVRFKFESNPWMFPSQNYKNFLLWIAFVLEKLKLDLKNFCQVKESNA
jgi:hypothetical protein